MERREPILIFDLRLLILIWDSYNFKNVLRVAGPNANLTGRGFRAEGPARSRASRETKIVASPQHWVYLDVNGNYVRTFTGF